MRLYDNDEYREEFMALVYGLLVSDGANDRANQIIDAFDCAPEVEAEPIPPNGPLALEELREMDGEPAYFQFGDGTQGWAIVERDVDGAVLYGPDFDDHAYPDGDFINMEYNDPAGHFGLHVLGWRAYRRKPENKA